MKISRTFEIRKKMIWIDEETYRAVSDVSIAKWLIKNAEYYNCIIRGFESGVCDRITIQIYSTKNDFERLIGAILETFDNHIEALRF